MLINKFFYLTIAVMVWTAAPSHADPGIADFYLDVWSDNRSSGEHTSFWLEPIMQDGSAHTAEAVSNAYVKDPSGVWHQVQPAATYDPGCHGGFFMRISGFIAGTYIGYVKDAKTGEWVRGVDAVPNQVLERPVISWPTEGASVNPLVTIDWNDIAGADYYRVVIFDKTWEEPVHWYCFSRKTLAKSEYRVPSGVLKSGHDYWMHVESRSSRQDMDARGRSDTVNFSVN